MTRVELINDLLIHPNKRFKFKGCSDFKIYRDKGNLVMENDNGILNMHQAIFDEFDEFEEEQNIKIPMATMVTSIKSIDISLSKEQENRIIDRIEDIIRRRGKWHL